jgi:hypothetical protein
MLLETDRASLLFADKLDAYDCTVRTLAERQPISGSGRGET